MLPNESVGMKVASPDFSFFFRPVLDLIDINANRLT